MTTEKPIPWQVLENEKSSNTTLITYYLKGNVENNTGQKLKQELSESDNIKSKETRTAVQDALRMMRRNLQSMQRTPPNGLVVFCGNQYYV